MKAADWRVIREIGYGVGAILFFAGFVAILYEEYRLFVKVAPYRDLGIVGLLSGVILFVIAYISDQRFKEEEKLESTPQIVETTVKEKFFCRYCGKENKPDATFCESCGKQLT